MVASTRISRESGLIGIKHSVNQAKSIPERGRQRRTIQVLQDQAAVGTVAVKSDELEVSRISGLC